MQKTKQQWREQLRAARKTVAPAVRDLASANVAECVLPLLEDCGNATVLLYESIATEFPTQQLIEQLLAVGVRVLVPSSCGKTASIDELDLLVAPCLRRLVQGDELHEILARTTLVLLPGLGFDMHGTRLGQGSGFYDRLLAILPAHTRPIGLAFSCQILPANERLPREEHDIPVKAVITENAKINMVKLDLM